jgi:chromosome segregation ATPase
LLHETEAIRAELEAVSSMKADHAEARSRILELERSIEDKDRSQESLFKKLTSMQANARSLSSEVSASKGVAESELSEGRRVVSDLTAAFDDLAQTFAAEMTSARQQNADLLQDLNRFSICFISSKKLNSTFYPGRIYGQLGR